MPVNSVITEMRHETGRFRETRHPTGIIIGIGDRAGMRDCQASITSEPQRQL
jgi:hypothetical protein